MKKGLFITFEGGEGSGKTTQIRLLKTHLETLGHRVICTREPGGTPFAEQLRTLLVSDTGHDISARCELALFISGRLHHVQNCIKPALDKGMIVLCDRYIDSTIVYQGIAGGLGKDMVIQSHEVLMGQDFIQPDATFCLDIDVDTGLSRSQGGAKNEDRFEKMDVSFHQQVRQGYLDMAQQSHRHTVIDATQDIQHISNQIIQTCEGILR